MSKTPQISLFWYGGDSIAGYTAQFKILDAVYEYSTSSYDVLDRIIRRNSYSPAQALNYCKKNCKLITKE